MDWMDSESRSAAWAADTLRELQGRVLRTPRANTASDGRLNASRPSHAKRDSEPPVSFPDPWTPLRPIGLIRTIASANREAPHCDGRG